MRCGRAARPSGRSRGRSPWPARARSTRFEAPPGVKSRRAPGARPLRQLRAHAPRDGRALRRRPGRRGAHAAPPRRLLTGRRRVLRGGSAARGRARRAGGDRPRRDRPGDRGPRARHRGSPAARRGRGPRLPAARDRLRALPARDPARRRRGRRAGAGHLPGRHPARRAAARPARSAHAARADRGARPVIEIEGLGEGHAVAVNGPRGVPSTLPVLPLRETVPLPDTLMPLAVGQERSVQLVNDVLAGDRLLVMVASKSPELEAPGPEDLYDVGVVGAVARMLKVPDGTLRIIVQGAQRVRISGWVRTTPYLVAEIEEVPDVVQDTTELTALVRQVQETFVRIVEQVPYLPEELQIAASNIEDPSALTHLIAGSLRMKQDERQALLEEPDVTRRLRRLVEILARELEVISIGTQIQTQVQSEIDKGQREFVLRQQLKAIQEELGEFDESAAEAEELREQLGGLDRPEGGRRRAARELRRLAQLPPQAAEHGVIRSYLEWIASLPWSTSTEDNLDLAHAREVLDADHYDIERVKDRILEFLAVRRLNPEAKGSILCFVGPPGVGKTSLGRSIARALGRSFERISVGGVRDEAEIRGHRRTYVGAMPGTIIRALRDAGSNNPLFMIDEIDKMGSDFRGDPSSAMLEVLDPEQNSTFRDHYLDVPFDLSKVMFVCTANDLDRVPGPLRDRMEVIELAGYTEEEKLEIAKRYLVPRQIDRNG